MIVNGLLRSNLLSMGAFRVALAVTLLVELVLRLTLVYDVYYSDQGIWPAEMMQARSSTFHNYITPHGWYHGKLFPWVYAVQFVAAACLLLGYHTRLSALVSWLLYSSLTLRNVWLSFIGDRYFHVLLFYAMFLPCGQRFSIDAMIAKSNSKSDNLKYSDNVKPTEPVNAPYQSILVAIFKLQVAWIYFDAGFGMALNQGERWGRDRGQG